jgi:hypothetical protein
VFFPAVLILALSEKPTKPTTPSVPEEKAAKKSRQNPLMEFEFEI